MRFEIGKSYKHSSGIVMRILACVNTTMYGRALIAEKGDTFGFQLVGFDNDGYGENWIEINEKEWLISSLMKQEQNNYPGEPEADKNPPDELKVYRRGYRDGQLDLMRELE